MLCILLAACSDSLFDGDGGKLNGEDRIQLSGSIEQLALTRVCDNGFCDGDVIGVYVVDYNGGTPGTLKPRGNRCDNVRHTFDEANNQWKPAYDIYWKDKHTQTDIRKIAQSSPFYNEAAKILKGKLTETDASRRRQILNYCEHLRTAYTTKDIDFLGQVFSDEALIIVGNVVKESATTAGIGSDSRVTYALHTKRDYLARLAKVFAINKTVDVKFSDFRNGECCATMRSVQSWRVV